MVGALVPAKVVMGNAGCAAPGRQPGDPHGGCGVCRHLVGVECRAVVAGVAVLELVDDVRREDMGLFDDADCGLGSIGLAVVVRDRTDVAACGGLTDGVGASLTTDGSNQGEGVFGGDVVIDAVRCGPVRQAGGVLGRRSCSGVPC